VVDRSRDIAMLDSIVAIWNAQVPDERTPTAPSLPTFFRFDPNSATLEEFHMLGFSRGLATRIDHYRQKGGKFFIKKDLLKIYGIDSSFYKQLSAFIDLPERSQQKKTHSQRTVYDPKTTSEKKATLRFDLNKADSTQLMSLGGIGAKRSRRIINYRQALGGFISMDQLQEVFGLDSTVIRTLQKESFVAGDFLPVTMNINTSDEKRLASHPYLSNAAARSIVAYRFQHGEFKTIEELRNIHALDEKTIQKITPYLTLGD
jgi:DNA uptake protein ComE-like DNA-binding protein